MMLGRLLNILFYALAFVLLVPLAMRLADEVARAIAAVSETL